MTEDKTTETNEEVKEVKEVKEVPVYKLVDVTTQSTPAIQTPEGKLISDSEGIVMLLNEVKQIKNLVG